ncbi:MAG: flavodoxin domain-containing protein [Opitutaceae bacterium]|nr:flavodoxin domain-containing protein [Opitutaceae bacterium]
MSSAPFIPDSAPFTAEQRAWLNGFFAGVFSRSQAGAAAVPAAPALMPLTILWGSQTGSSEALAKRAAKEAGKRGFAATLLDMGSVDAPRLATEKNVLVITSTYGDGEPPDNAKALHAALRTDIASSLTNVRFSVCALGDSNYVHFCQCGKDFDAFLEKRGATRVAPRADCDIDYEEKFTTWLVAALGGFGASTPSAGALSIGNRESQIDNGSAFSRANPFPAPLLTVRRLNGDGSAKEVNHVEFSLEGSGLSYEAGDALGVYPHNCPGLVNDVLAAIGCDGEEAVISPVGGGDVPLRRALTEFYDLGKPTPELLQAIGTPVGAHHVIDALATTGGLALKPADLLARLKRLQPRLYSISSSPKAHPGQVHLTVGAVRYELAGRARKGVCSTFLPERGAALGTVGVFVHANKAFRPPANPDAPMIMVGPGTGIAPFRAFLEERRAIGARGKNWLFFGDQKEASDFLYREELDAMRADGTLTRLDLAWSRDQAAKIYVQNRMLEHAKELFAWLDQGGSFYVCGDASRMAKDVDAALHKVVEAAGGKTTEGAVEYVNALRAAKRYQRDVY